METIEIENKFNYKINVDKEENKHYNITNIEIFTINEYIEYKQKYDLNIIGLSDGNKEYQHVNNVHDKIYRKLLENKKNAIRVINNFLDLEDKIEEKQIEKYNSSYVSDELRNLEADIVYKIKDEEVFFLIEHQTKVDYSMAYRILKYELSIIDSSLQEKKLRYQNKGYIYPLIIPIVLYTGINKWDAKLNLRRLQPKWNKYEGMELSKYNILDINDLDKKELIKEENIISKLLIIEKSNTQREFIENLKEIFKEINKKSYTKEEIKLCEITIKAMIKNNLNEKEANEILENIKFERRDNMFRVDEMFKREEKRFREEGKTEGKTEGKIEMIKNMLKEKISINIIESVSGMKKSEIEKIAKDI